MIDRPPSAHVPPIESAVASPSDLSFAEREAAELSAGRTVDELRSDATINPRIPPLSLDEQLAATSTNTDQAVAEEKSLSSFRTAEELAQRAREMEADRHQRFRDAFEHIAILALYVGAAAIGVLSTIWTLHLVLPADRRWLTAEDLTHVQTLLTAGVLVGVVGGHFKKRLKDQD